ncbi:MAG: hypothetical protein KBA31_01050 [Alphaproteobacteria bacterium]|nr:hypothetical protein [Alphaproteobacteria bacterium]
MNATLRKSEFDVSSPVGPWSRQLHAASTDIASTQALTLASVEWQIAVHQRLGHLMRLERGWDGYGGLPVKREVLQFALRILAAVMDDTAVSPQIVPISDGSLQLEWHKRDVHLEVHVLAPYRVQVVYERNAQEDEFDVVGNFARIQQLVPAR